MMELVPALKLGWFNGWILLAIEFLIQGFFLLIFPKPVVALFVIFLGICLAIGSWAALLMLLMSRLLQHFSILAEEAVCLQRYGQPYRLFMERVPRYFLFF
jgi:hypothetical protein